MSYLVKLMARQQPGSANVLAPVLGLVAALMVFAAIPFGENITWAGQMHAVQVADPGLLYVLAVLVLFFFAPLWGGWSAGDQRSLLDGVRHAARQLGYLLCIGLSAVGILLLSGSASLADIVQAQARSCGRCLCGMGGCSLWAVWFSPSPGSVGPAMPPLIG